MRNVGAGIATYELRFRTIGAARLMPKKATWLID